MHRNEGDAYRRCLTAQARYAEADEHLQATLPVLEREYGDAHKDTREALAELSAVWERPAP